MLPNVGQVTFFKLEGLVLAESAGVADSVVLHFVAKPLIDIPEVGGIAVRICAEIWTEIGKDMSSPHSLVLELLHTKAERAFNFVLRARSQLIELWNSDSG
jgi:hypothetical protein